MNTFPANSIVLNDINFLLGQVLKAGLSSLQYRVFLIEFVAWVGLTGDFGVFVEGSPSQWREILEGVF